MSFVNKKTVIRVLRVLVALGLVFLFYRQLFSGGKFVQLSENFVLNSRNFSYGYLIICVILMPVNWMLEALKWQILTKAFHPLSYRDALSSVLSGVSLGVLTPARIGEYGGRMLHLHPDHKLASIGATFTGSIAQNTINAAVALPLSYYFLKSVFDVTYGWSSTFLTLITAGVIISLTVYYNIGRLIGVAERFEFFKSKPELIKKFGYAAEYDSGTLNRVILLSVTRYIVYCIQYLCIVWFFNFGQENIILAGAIATIYLVQSGIPLPPVMGLMARGELAILIWSHMQVDAVTALGATLMLWTINLMIPALAGLWIIWKIRI
jgi:hypothetical protein